MILLFVDLKKLIGVYFVCILGKILIECFYLASFSQIHLAGTEIAYVYPLKIHRVCLNH